MLAKIKYKLRRLAQKITGLDADNSAIDVLINKINYLETEINSIKRDFLFNERLIPDVLDNFVGNDNILNEKNYFIEEIDNLGLLNKETEVLELMCVPGLNAWKLKDKVLSYTGYDSSEIGLKYLNKQLPNFRFSSTLMKNEKLFDLVIINSSKSRWSKISTEYYIDLARDCVKPGGAIAVYLPYPDTIFDSEGFDKLRYQELGFLLAKNINSNKVANL